MSLSQLLIQVAARGTLLLLLTALAGLIFRRASAATRHLIWTGGLVASLIVPLISVSEPALPVLPSLVATPSVVSPSTEAWSGTLVDPTPKSSVSSVTSVDASVPSVESVDPSVDISWIQIIGITWLLGLTLVTLRLIAGWIAIAQLERRAVVVASPEWLATIRGLWSVTASPRVVRYLESSEVSTPCTWGTIAPTVLLPATGAAWSAEERRQVIVHELAHVRRYDCATQVVSTLAVALNWFNPLAWYAQRQSRVAREQACDDAVLAAGAMASTYAGLLLAAAAPEGGRWLPSEAQAMARRSQIGDRLLAVLDPARRRQPVNRRAVSLISASAFAVALPVVSIGFQAPPVAPAAPAAPVPSTSSASPVPSTSSVSSASPVPSVPSACDMSKTSSSQASFSDDDGDERKNYFTLSWKGGGCVVKMEGRGKITFTASEDDVAALSEGGRFEIETTENGVDRNYRVLNRKGTIERRYQVDDRDATLDAAALQWRAGLILEFIRRSGYDAEARAGRILKRGGVDALTREIALIHSDGARAIYIKVGLDGSRTNAADVSRLLVLARTIGSDGDKAGVLKATPVALLSSTDVQRAYADAAGSIGSDGDLSEVLKSAIGSGRLSPGSCEWVLGLTDNIGSDGDKSSVLMTATDALQWNSTCVRRSLEVTRRIGSDGDKSATLIRFLQRHGLPGDLVPVFFETTATIGSDSDHSSVLHRVIDLSSTSDAVVEGLLKDSRRIGSDGDHSSVLVAAARRGLIKSERLKTLYRESARAIGSDGDREEALRALERT